MKKGRYLVIMDMGAIDSKGAERLRNYMRSSSESVEFIGVLTEVKNAVCVIDLDKIETKVKLKGELLECLKPAE